MEMQPFSFRLHGSNQWPGLGKWPKLLSITASLANVEFEHTDTGIAVQPDTRIQVWVLKSRRRHLFSH